MINNKNIKFWYFVHKWTSLICAIFVLLLCLTGLPLIFKAELAALSTSREPLAILPANTPLVSLDTLTAISHTMYPGQSINYVSLDTDEPLVYIGMTSLDTSQNYHWLKFDARTAQVIEESKQSPEQGLTFLSVMSGLHRNLLAGQGGYWLLGLMCLVFLFALISGVALYGPFTKTVPFGTVRSGVPRRIWMDWHKLLGMITFIWAGILSVTGILLVVYGPVYDLWQQTVLPQALATYQGQSTPLQLSSLQQVVNTVENTLPDQEIVSIDYPNETSVSPHHYFIWTTGTTPLTAYLHTPTLVDAATGEFAVTLPFPWYMKFMRLAGALHYYGNHDGLLLKILWALLDILTIAMLVSGIYAWLLKFKKHPTSKSRAPQQAAAILPIRQSSRQVWSIPFGLGALSLFGMFAPLLGPGIWQWLAGLALAIPVSATFWYWLHSKT
jgi:uncharacterized iron-regulated membrane protein